MNKKVIGICVIVLLLMGLGAWLRLSQEEVKYVQPTEAGIDEQVRAIFAGKLSVLKQDLLDRLAECETGFLSETNAESAIVFDTNNKPSIGVLQFQRETVMHYMKVFGEGIERREAIEIAVDPIKARKLAERIIFETEDGIDNWWTCSRKLGLESEVKLIKKLEL